MLFNILTILVIITVLAVLYERYPSFVSVTLREWGAWARNAWKRIRQHWGS